MTAKDGSRLAIAVLTVAVPALYLRHSLFATGPVTGGLQAVAGLLMLSARVTFGRRSFHGAANPTEGGLVTTGPYRFLRHPIYSAILLFVWVGVACHLSFLNGALGMVATMATGVRIRAEEHLLLEHYPEYGAYATRTKRLIPFVL